jgi:hypothetical protein
MKKIIRLTEGDLTKLVIRTINEIREENPYHNLKKFIEDKIDFEGYDIKVSPNRKISQLFDVFMDEYGWAIKRYGLKKAMIEWLQGLPSVIDLPYYYYDISNLLYALGFDEVKDMEDNELSDFYYDLLAKIIIDNK